MHEAIAARARKVLIVHNGRIWFGFQDEIAYAM
jgi:hypothetical protein